jgi:hypothetical protein
MCSESSLSWYSLISWKYVLVPNNIIKILIKKRKLFVKCFENDRKTINYLAFILPKTLSIFYIRILSKSDIVF